MTIYSAPPPPAPPPRALPKNAYISWSRRLFAFLIDWAPISIGFYIPYVAGGFESAEHCTEYCDEPTDAWVAAMLIATLLCAVYFFWNFCYRQGKTGQSIGKSAMHFVVINETTWQPIGFWRSLLRQIAHYVDQLICYIGYLWPLWDSQRQTIADKIMSTVCVPVGTPRPPPRPSYGAIAEPTK